MVRLTGFKGTDAGRSGRIARVVNDRARSPGRACGVVSRVCGTVVGMEILLLLVGVGVGALVGWSLARSRAAAAEAERAVLRERLAAADASAADRQHARRQRRAAA